MGWNEDHQCLTDYMGLPLSKTEVRDIMAKCKVHLKQSEIKLAASYNKIAETTPGTPPEHKVHAEDMQ